jgi:hypothetical protein
LEITWFTANGRVAPVTGSRAPTPVALVPFRESKRPAATTCFPPPVTTRARTLLLVFWFAGSLLGSRLPEVGPTPGTGAHGSSAPFDAETAASRFLLVEPAELKDPPAYTVSLVAASAFTRALNVGWKLGISSPVAVL